MTIDTKQVRKRIHDYLATGGLFNPELANHDAVRDLIMDCADEIDRLRDRGETQKSALELQNLTMTRLHRSLEAAERVRDEALAKVEKARDWAEDYAACAQLEPDCRQQLLDILDGLRVPELENSE